MKKKIQGSVSIFLALILMPTYLLSVAAIDGARLYAANNYLLLANEAAIESLKHNYDRVLKDNFSLYALDQAKSDSGLKNLANRVVGKNLSFSKENYNKLEIIETDLIVDNNENLANPEVLKSQIYDYMKYRLPVAGLHSFINLFQAYEETEKYNHLMEKKYAYNEALEKKSKDLSSFYQDLLTYSTDSKYVNDHFESFLEEKEELRDEYSIKTIKIKGLKKKDYDYSKWEVEALRKELIDILDDKTCQEIFKLSIFIQENKGKIEEKDYFLKFEESFVPIKESLDRIMSISKIKVFEYQYKFGEGQKNLIEEVYKIDAERSNCMTSYSEELKDRAIKFLTDYGQMSKRIKSLIKTSTSLDKSLADLWKKSSQLSSKLKEWKEAIEDVEDPIIKTELKSEFEYKEQSYDADSIKSFKKRLVIDRDKLSNLDSKIFGSKGMLEELKESYEKFFSFEEEQDLDGMEGLVISKPEDFKFYNNFIKTYKSVNANYEKDQQAKSLYDKLKAYNKNISDESEGKKSIFDFIAEDKYLEIMEGSLPTPLIDNDILTSKMPENSSEIKNVYAKANKHKFIKDRDSLVENIFITFYIDEKFSDKFVEFDGQSFPQKEFILFGANKLSSNVQQLQAAIFAMRLAANSVYAYTNPQIRKEALLLSTSLAGWTGIGIPIMQGIIIALMALGESGLDSYKLAGGKPVELYKNNSSWQLSLNGLKNMSVNTIKDLSKKSIDKVFNKGETILQEAREGGFNSLNQFISQSQDSLVQRVSGSILVPIQNKIIDLIANASKPAGKEIDDLFKQLRKDVYLDLDPLSRKIKLDLISLIEKDYKTNLTKLLEERLEGTSETIISYLDEMTATVEKTLLNQSKKAEEDLKEKISELAKSGSKNAGEKVNEVIDEFLTKISGTAGGNSRGKSFQSVKAGLSFDYSDYLKLFTFLALSGGKQENILKRIALVIDIEMNSIREGFDILKSYTRFKLNSKVSLPLILDVFSDGKKKREFESQLEGAYDEI